MSTLTLRDRSREKIFFLVEDSDLKFPSKMSSMLNKQDCDQDNATTSSLIKRVVRSGLSGLKKAIKR